MARMTFLSLDYVWSWEEHELHYDNIIFVKVDMCGCPLIRNMGNY